jgi:hypothetical protein
MTPYTADTFVTILVIVVGTITFLYVVQLLILNRRYATLKKRRDSNSFDRRSSHEQD